MERTQKEIQDYIDKLFDDSDREVIRILSKYLTKVRHEEAIAPDVA